MAKSQRRVVMDKLSSSVGSVMSFTMKDYNFRCPLNLLMSVHGYLLYL